MVNEIIPKMPRQLTFLLQGKEHTAVPVKVDRRKLYGWTEIVATDDRDRPFNLVNTDETGTLLIPRGGTALGILAGDGNWVDRSTLVTVTEEGTPAPLIKSSFSVTIELSERISENDFLDHSITDFYQLTDIDEGFSEKIGKDIYGFTYTYLDSYEGNPAFVMLAQGTPFMFIGYRNRFNMLCLGDCEVIDDDDDYIELDDDIDFSMF